MRTVLVLLLAGCGPAAPPVFATSVAGIRARVSGAAGCVWPSTVVVRRVLFPLGHVPANTLGQTTSTGIEILPLVDGDAEIRDTDDASIALPLETFQRTLVHEFGHVAGLGHSEDPKNVMWAHGGSADIPIEVAIAQITPALRARCR